jgi:hypothetical protein
MKNTLIQDNLDKLMTLSKEDREMVITYFNNWTESDPAYYEDGETMQDKLENLFEQWLKTKQLNLTDEEVSDILEWSWDALQEWASHSEYCVDSILDVAHNKNIDKEFHQLYEDFLSDQE